MSQFATLETHSPKSVCVPAVAADCVGTRLVLVHHISARGGPWIIRLELTLPNFLDQVAPGLPSGCRPLQPPSWRLPRSTSLLRLLLQSCMPSGAEVLQPLVLAARCSANRCSITFNASLLTSSFGLAEQSVDVAVPQFTKIFLM